MIDILAIGMVTALVLVALVATRNVWEPDEFRVVMAGFVATAFATTANVYGTLYLFSITDVWLYHNYGRDLSAAIRSSPGSVVDVVWLILQREYSLSVFVPKAGDSTGSMIGLTGLFHVVTQDNLGGTTASFAYLAFVGRLAMLRALRSAYPQTDLVRVAAACLLVPTAVWWSAGIIKEGVATFGLGVFLLGLVTTFERRSPAWGLPMLVVGAVPMLYIKPYILVAAGVASAAYVYWVRVVRTGGVIRPVPLLVGIFVGTLAVVGVGQVSPRFSVNNLVDEAVRMQEAGYRDSGGSNYTLGDTSSLSWRSQLAVAPLAVFTGLFRPGLWEARNAMMLANGLETTLFFLATVFAAVQLGVRGGMRYLREHPVAAFLLVFVAVLSFATGLTSANLGTLSRYRMPLVPLFAVLLATGSRGR
jgi:hypothetical protein